MVKKKTPKNKTKKSDKPEPKSKPGKTKLPAFGLAEDIIKEPGRNTASTLPKERRVNKTDIRKDAGEEDVVERRVNKYLPRPEDDISEKFVTFYLDSEEYALSIFQVQEINRVEKITRVPNSPDHVSGVINLRGRIIPVIDLKKRLKIGQCNIDRDSRIVIIENGTKVIGLLVDRVSQVLNILPSQIEDAPEEIVQLNDNYLKGVGKLDDRMIILLDLAQLIDQENQAYGEMDATRPK